MDPKEAGNKVLPNHSSCQDI